MALPRDDRIVILRAPGGLSGQNWMPTATAEPLAAAWVDLWNADATHDVMLDFARLGEARAARIAAMTLAKRERTGFAPFADDPAYPPSARAFAIREWRRMDPARAGREEAALAPADPQGEVLGLRGGDPADWLPNNPEGDPLVALCAATCPDANQPACLTASYEILGGYWPLMALGSPVEAIIPSDRFNRSSAGLQSTVYGLRREDTGLACLNAALD
jgi:hypothetical protein